MKVLLTGGLGVIGSNLTDLYFSKYNCQIDIIDIGDQPRHNLSLQYLASKHKNLYVIKNKLENYNIPNIEQYDFIVHTAASTNIPGSIADPITDFNSNVLATHKLLEQLRLAKRKIPTFIFSSVKPYAVDTLDVELKGTRYVWSENPIGIPEAIGEEFPLKCDEPYASGKACQSMLCQSYAISYDLPIVIARFSNLYAPMQAKTGHGWLHSFCIKQALDQEITVEGLGFQVRDMLYVDDIFNAVECGINNIDKTQKEIFNIGGGKDNTTSVIEAVHLLEKISNKKVKYKYGEGRKHEDLIFITDHSKFTDLTGWTPQISVEEGMTRIYNWALQNKKQLASL